MYISVCYCAWNNKEFYIQYNFNIAEHTVCILYFIRMIYINNIGGQASKITSL